MTRKFATTGEITRLLSEYANGDEAALGRLYEAALRDLRRLAHARIARRSLRASLSTTEVINESFIRLLEDADARWPDRRRFFGYIGRLMERVVVDSIRVETAKKRGGGAQRVPLEVAIDECTPRVDTTLTLAVGRALDDLATTDIELATIVRLRFFGEMSHEDIADALGMSKRTVIRRWNIARLWLCETLEDFDA